MKELIIALLLIMGSSAIAQTTPLNYVPNGDFELYSKCPTIGDQIMLATGWTPIDTVTKNLDSSGNHSCSAEYCNECAPTSAYFSTVPMNGLFYQYPHSGKGMASVWMYVNYDSSQSKYYLRDYIQSRLVRKLTAGKRYCVSFYVNLAEVSGYAIKEISAYLDNGSIDATPFCGLPQTQCVPQLTNNGGIITDTAGWTKIEGPFIATGNEQFITIGNFKDKAHTTYVAVPKNQFNGSSPGTAYLVDDVSVIESTTVADAGPDKHVGKGDSIYIGRPKEVGLECTWSVLGSTAVIGTGAGIWVKPAATTSYVVTQTLCGNITKDTVRVEVWAAGVNSINGQSQQYTLLPNPNDGRMQLLQAVTDKQPVSIKVYNVVGAVVHSSARTFEDKSATLNLGSITPGVYNMVLHDSAGIAYMLKFVKK